MTNKEIVSDPGPTRRLPRLWTCGCYCGCLFLIVAPAFLTESVLQSADRFSDAIHVRIETQRGAERLERRPMLAHLQVRLAQPRLGTEVIRVQVQHALAIGDRALELFQAKVNDGTLIVRLRELGRPQDKSVETR